MILFPYMFHKEMFQLIVPHWFKKTFCFNKTLPILLRGVHHERFCHKSLPMLLNGLIFHEEKKHYRSSFVGSKRELLNELMTGDKLCKLIEQLTFDLLKLKGLMKELKTRCCV